jgi:hypothetical protein
VMTKTMLATSKQNLAKSFRRLFILFSIWTLEIPPIPDWPVSRPPAASSAERFARDPYSFAAEVGFYTKVNNQAGGKTSEMEKNVFPQFFMRNGK